MGLGLTQSLGQIQTLDQCFVLALAQRLDLASAQYLALGLTQSLGQIQTLAQSLDLVPTSALRSGLSAVASVPTLALHRALDPVLTLELLATALAQTLAMG